MSSFISQPRAWPWVSSKPAVLLPEDSDIAYRISDISDGQYTSTLHTSPVEAGKALGCSPQHKARVRIISIYSKRTISPLDTTEALLVHLFNKYNIHKEFTDVVASFGQEPNIAEGCVNNTTIHTKESGDYNVSYQLRYVELNNRAGQDPWSLRHSGVYHHHSSSKGLDIFILLHCIRKPTVEETLATLQDDMNQRHKLCGNPSLLHTWIFETYSGNWRWYIKHLGERFSQENDLAMVVELDSTKPHPSFRRLQRLRNAKDLIIFARACCSGNYDLLNLLNKLVNCSADGSEALGIQISRMQGYIDSADALKERIQNLIDLLEAAKVDTELRDLTEGLRKLTEDTVDDSATVKIATYVSAVYLPGSFVATLFGMNFFAFNETSKHLEISKDFWMFAASWLPLTFVTGAIYVLIRYLASSKKSNTVQQLLQVKSCSCKASV